MQRVEDGRELPTARRADVSRARTARPSFTRRGAVLQGVSAHEWFADQGFVVESGQFHLVTDIIVAPRLRLARIWHSAGRMTAEREEREAPLVLLQLESTSQLRIGTASQTLRPGCIAFIPPDLPLTVTSDSAVARIEIELHPLPIESSILDTLERELVLNASGAPFWSVLVASVNTALNGTLEPDDYGFPSLHLALGHLVAAALTGAAGRHAPHRTTRQKDLFDSARRIIARDAADPGFTVAGLAQELNVSQPYLRTIFSAHGTTARAQIRLRRAATAREHLAARDGRQPFTAAEAARLSGFRDVDTMRSALRLLEQ